MSSHSFGIPGDKYESNMNKSHKSAYSIENDRLLLEANTFLLSEKKVTDNEP